MNRRHVSLIALVLVAGLTAGCSTSEIKPVEIFPEDNCSNCRMAISDKSFASEIITSTDEVFKFDDLGCIESFRKKNPALKIKGMFVVDYESKQWLPYDKSVVVKTSLSTPMGSGKVAVRDSARARVIAEQHPAPTDLSQAGCCSSD